MISEEEVKRVYATASQSVKDYVNSNEVFDAFHEIRKSHNLHLDHAGNLAMAIDAVILGMRSFSELPTLLRDALPGVDDATREKVVQDVNDKIFVPLRELTKKRAEAPASVPTVPRPTSGIRAVERTLVSEAPPPVRPQPTEEKAEAPTTRPVAPQQSVVEQKMPGVVQSSESRVQSATPPKVAPPAPPKYHGADPYRELPE